MTKRKTAAAKPEEVTLREFRRAFSRAVPAFIADDKTKNLKKKIESVFPSNDPSASVSVKEFLRHSRSVAAGSKKPKDDGHFGQSEARRIVLLASVYEQMPTLRRVFAEKAKQDSARWERVRRRESSKPETLSSRVARLERENAELRARIDSRPMTAEEELKMRKSYEENDTRIGGSHAPEPKFGPRD